ncbi:MULTISPECIES: alpha/beta hydrolase [unclassified Caulobacter]|uniref:alpha/beta hydrolase n=1 Tax=unclassified Caulobacter TaxID=2648921 RepID=UPI000D393FA7|nr:MULTISPECIES: alpha/beta hydrolase [unclassified Caulobacter]PTS81720.1 alpha/beta hydrolase [Caulobacter sp. HMWF009]PTT08941.1 alpha/beta hydrolase [Caulobacter sp. HMWF025]
MTESPEWLVRDDKHRLAYRQVSGEGATVVWLGGFHSDMTGSKAQTLAEQAEATGGRFLRFDYFGHGESDGRFADGTISRWRADALAAVDELTEGPLILVGSSMGGWIACLVALARPERVRAMVLIAPAPDFTEKLMAPELSEDARAAIARDGFWIRPSDYDDGGYPITRALLEDGAQWSILPGPVPIDVPVRILQGGADPDVPWTHALALANALTGQDVVFTLIKDGDHRLSRPQDLERLTAAVSEARGLVEIDDDPVARRLARAARARGASLASAAAWAAADLGPDED